MIDDQMLIEPALSEPLTWQEICARHPNEWVVLVEVQARSVWPRYGELAHFFTGPIRAASPLFVGLA